MIFSAAAVRTAATGAMLVLILVITSCATTSEADGKVRVAGVREAVSLIASGDYVVLDVRSADAFAAGHVRQARSLPYRADTFDDQLAGLDPEESYLVYSRDGSDAARVADVLVATGFTDVVDAGAFGLLALAGAEIE